MAVSPHRSSYPPEDSPCPQPFYVAVVVASSDFSFPSIRDRPDVSVARSAVLAVSMGRCPSRLCSVSRYVPSSTVFGRSLAYPPWALFPFEVAFMLFLSVQPSSDDALHHRYSATAYRCIRVRPILAVRRAPCRVRVLCARDPSFLGNPTSSSSVCTIRRMMPRRSVALPSRSTMFPSTTTSDARGVTRVRLRRRFADPPSSCGVLSDTSRCVHREMRA